MFVARIKYIHAIESVLDDNGKIDFRRLDLV